MIYALTQTGVDDVRTIIIAIISAATLIVPPLTALIMLVLRNYTSIKMTQYRIDTHAERLTKLENGGVASTIIPPEITAHVDVVKSDIKE